jgi:hypothetical protein
VLGGLDASETKQKNVEGSEDAISNLGKHQEGEQTKNIEAEEKTPNPPRKQSSEAEVKTPGSPRKQKPVTETETLGTPKESPSPRSHPCSRHWEMSMRDGYLMKN